MRTSRVLVLSILALGVGFVAARWSVAQPTGDSSRKRSDNDSHNLWAAEVTRFVGHLQDTKQT